MITVAPEPDVVPFIPSPGQVRRLAHALVSLGHGAAYCRSQPRDRATWLLTATLLDSWGCA